MDIASVLGFGAIGLGFLLACLAYRLLARDTVRERPIYVFMAFCLVLVAVGAGLQYVDGRSRATLETKLAATEVSLNETRAQNQRLTENMQAINTTLTAQLEPLRTALVYMTGNSCGGGSSGVPLQHGSAYGAKISEAIKGIATAQSLAKQYVK